MRLQAGETAVNMYLEYIRYLPFFHARVPVRRRQILSSIHLRRGEPGMRKWIPRPKSLRNVIQYIASHKICVGAARVLASSQRHHRQ
jgi:hypothetical protein